MQKIRAERQKMTDLKMQGMKIRTSYRTWKCRT